MILFSIILNSFIAVGVQKVAFKLYKQVCFYRRWSNNKTQFVAFWSREKKEKKGEKKKKKINGNMVLNIHRNRTKVQSANLLRILAVIVLIFHLL